MSDIDPSLPSESFSAVWRDAIYDVIARRRDVRKFRKDPLSEEQIARILSAAHQGPSVGYMQPWNFILINDPGIRGKVKQHVEVERLRAADGFEGNRREQYVSFKLEGILESPLNLCVTCDPTRQGPHVIGRNTIRETDIYSTCCAIQNLWLAARAEGIGVGWVSILQPDFLKDLLGIPPAIMVVGYLCIGYPLEFAPNPELEAAGWQPRLPLTSLVFADRWAQRPSERMRQALHSECPSTQKNRTQGEDSP